MTCMLASMRRRWIIPAAYLILAVPARGAVTRIWERVIPDAVEDAFVVLDATGNPRVVSANASGLLTYAALDRDGVILASGGFPAAADGRYYRPFSAAATADGGATACGVASTQALFPATPTSDGLAVRFSASGTPLWSKVLGYEELGLCGLRSLRNCTTTSGSIFGVGTAAPNPLPPFPGLPDPTPSCGFDLANFNSFLVRLDEASGAVTGLRTFSIIPDGTQYIALASSGAAIYALGTRGSAMILDRYDLSLNRVWTATPATSAMPISVAVSSRGEVAVLGQRGTLDARVFRFSPEGSSLGEAVIPFPESTGVALTGGSTSYVTGRRSSHAAMASASHTDAVTVEFEDAAAQRYLSVAVDGANDIFATVKRISDVRVARFTPPANACGFLQTDNFKQYASPWATDHYDNICRGITTNKIVRCQHGQTPPAGTVLLNIRNKGCGLSTIATLNNYFRAAHSLSIPLTNPGDLNTLMVNRGYFSGLGDVDWGVIGKITGQQVRYLGKRDVELQDQPSVFLAEADTDIAAGRPVVFRVLTDAFSDHFITAVGKCGTKYLVANPGAEAREWDPAIEPIFGTRRFARAGGL